MADVFTPWPPGERELGWLAGLLEGEGSFYQTKEGYPAISIGMNDEDVIAHAAKLMGVSVSPFVPKTGKTTYRVHIKSRVRAGRIMSTLYPLMGERRQRQIVAALRFPEAADGE